MCLSVVYRGKQKKEALAKLPESFYVWKVADEYKDRFYTPFRDVRLHSGEMQFKANIINSEGSAYRGGGHFWRSREGAKNFTGDAIVRCRAKKSDISSIGLQWRDEVIVLKKAIFPKWVGEAG